MIIQEREVKTTAYKNTNTCDKLVWFFFPFDSKNKNQLNLQITNLDLGRNSLVLCLIVNKTPMLFTTGAHSQESCHFLFLLLMDWTDISWSCSTLSVQSVVRKAHTAGLPYTGFTFLFSSNFFWFFCWRLIAAEAELQQWDVVKCTCSSMDRNSRSPKRGYWPTHGS